ncbi:D-alanyl-D-alanine carboxypeptidase [Luteimonas cucumeris]|uniref:D-alanyl-D-alanine carboxypeptidase n=1 Tax=Luteimonas cucumeris TaxID=985012 RepID=A0A562KUM8_9GAMM|nr:M15 family metallopeptidase [Luteimonas cucumeris]TWH99046.1 D-alanyl-D-alanine carboxypeptidase [Luteimonas cucumeris]
MRAARPLLVNTDEIEIWPGGLLRARANHDARALSRARHVLRCKRDGRYLAADLPEGLLPLVQRLMREPGMDQALDALGAIPDHRRSGVDVVGTLPLTRLRDRLEALGLDDSYGERTGLPLVAEPAVLQLAGFDRYRRPLWLHPLAARAWQAMYHAANRDDIVLEAISGYRSHDYQLGIFGRKLARGQDVDEILTVNAAPGYSEHHSGRALDISAPEEPPAEESFEHSDAFRWLAAHAGEYGFVMSYPRDNPHGIVYEPWHWCLTG